MSLDAARRHHQAGELDKAEALCRQILAADGRNADAACLLGLLHLQRGRLAEALDQLERAAQLAPQSAEAHFHLGSALAQSGQLEDAIDALTRAVGLKPDLGAAHYNLGSAYRDIGNPVAALEAYQRAADLVPGSAQVHLAVGMVQRELEQFDEALQTLTRALAIKPDADIHYELGNLRTAMGDWREAVAHFSAAVKLRPDFAQARWTLAMAQLPPVEDMGVDLAERRQAFARELDALQHWFRGAPRRDAYQAVAVHQPFYLAYHDASNRDLLARYGRLCAEAMGTAQQAMGLTPRPPSAGRRMKIGIVSAHVYHHSVWSVPTRGWVEKLDPKRFELHVFSLGSQADEETQFARSRVRHFHEGPHGFERWAQLIHGAALDALIYPEVGMDAKSARLAAMRLAPLQLAGWGHPETTGLPTIDHFLSAAALEPPDAQQHYTERLEALPGLGCWMPRVARPIVAGSIPQGAPLLVCPGTPQKYSARHDGLFASIARRLPGSRFVFFRGDPPHLSRRFENRLRPAFEGAGLDFDRQVTFLPWQSLPGFRGLMSRADLYLDSVGFSGFNSALQAIECGLPIVTLEGRFMRGRLASGMLKQIGLDELVATSDEAYIELAVALGGDAARRARLRERIARNRDSLYEDMAPVKALAAFLERAGRS